MGVRLAWQIHCQPLGPFFHTLKRGAGFVGNRSIGSFYSDTSGVLFLSNFKSADC
jgi:hypothetical protein